MKNLATCLIITLVCNFTSLAQPALPQYSDTPIFHPIFHPNDTMRIHMEAQRFASNVVDMPTPYKTVLALLHGEVPLPKLVTPRLIRDEARYWKLDQSLKSGVGELPLREYAVLRYDNGIIARLARQGQNGNWILDSVFALGKGQGTPEIDYFSLVKEFQNVGTTPLLEKAFGLKLPKDGKLLDYRLKWEVSGKNGEVSELTFVELQLPENYTNGSVGWLVDDFRIIESGSKSDFTPVPSIKSPSHGITVMPRDGYLPYKPAFTLPPRSAMSHHGLSSAIRLTEAKDNTIEVTGSGQFAVAKAYTNASNPNSAIVIVKSKGGSMPVIQSNISDEGVEVLGPTYMGRSKYCIILRTKSKVFLDLKSSKNGIFFRTATNHAHASNYH